MNSLTPRERVLRTIRGHDVDRLAVYDIIHNVDLIEHLAGERITPRNAEDLTCRAVSKVLDMVRHFCIPTDLEPKEYTDEDGFTYRHQWWTREIVDRPNKTVDQTRELMKADVERVYRAIEKGEVCWQALEHLELLGEHCKTFSEIEELFRRIAGKLDGTLMITPEALPGMYTATNRYGFEMVIYTYHDHPDDFLSIYQAFCDYEVAKIHALAGLVDVAPVALLSEAVAFNTGLIFPMDFVREVQYPNIRRIIDAYKSHGFTVIFHADGNKWPILDDIISFGADVIDPCETLATMEIRQLREKYPETTFASPVDCQVLLAHGTTDEVTAACLKVLGDCGGRRVLTGSTSEIHPEISVENAMAMYDVFRNYNDPAFASSDKKGR